MIKLPAAVISNVLEYSNPESGFAMDTRKEAGDRMCSDLQETEIRQSSPASCGRIQLEIAVYP